MQRAAVFPRCNLAVGDGGLCEGALVQWRNQQVQDGVEPLRALQVELRQLDRRDLACPQQLCQLTHAGKGKLVLISDETGNIDRRCLSSKRARMAAPGLVNGRVHMRAHGHGIEHNCRCDGVGQVQIADGLQTCALGAHTVEHHRLLLVGQRDAGDGRCRVQHGRCDRRESIDLWCVCGCRTGLRRCGLHCNCRESAGQQGLADTGRSTTFEKHPPVHHGVHCTANTRPRCARCARWPDRSSLFNV